MPAPPHRSGTATPRRPRSPRRATISRGNRWVRSISAAAGAICLVANSRAVSRISFCSGESSRSMGDGYCTPRTGSPARPAGGALLDEGAHPFFLIVCGEEPREELALELVAVAEGQVGTTPDDPLGVRD